MSSTKVQEQIDRVKELRHAYGLDSQLEELTSLPSELHAEVQVANRLKDDIREAEDNLRRAEDLITQDVAFAKDDNGKPLYSNETARKIEVNNRIRNNSPCTVLQKQIEDFRRDLNSAETTAQELRDRMRVLLAKKDIYVAELKLYE